MLFPAADTMTQILIIDDDPAIQVLLQRTLQRQGYEILLANSGKEGLIQAQDHQPALIICDWLMPGGMDGLEVCRWVKSIPQLATTFFISEGKIYKKSHGLL